jgi:tetratricopeptide (TPR) repeat protein
METTASSPLGFVQRRLPWLIIGGALVLFLVTLNTSYAFRGLPTLAVASGIEWRPQFVAPVHFLVTYPLRWLPVGIQPTAMNVFAAACAALSLGLLARSVALLPHDRTRDQRNIQREQSLLNIPVAWVPPVVAALVCALQLTFWENAIVGTGEAFDLLLFAYVVRGLLEFRITRKDSWLYRAALVQGLAMTNNYAMVAFFPVFLAALIWIRGIEFFRVRFLLRMFLFGLIGLSGYLILPIINSFSGVPEAGFWPSFTTQLGLQRQSLVRCPPYIIFLLSFTSLFPVLFIGIRWPAQFGDVSAAGNLLTNLMMHVIHAVFLVACLAVTFDLPFGPRRLAMFWEMLPIYYLGALSVGYFVGYFLLVFTPRSAAKSWQRPSPLRQAINYVVVGLTWVAAAGVPAGLIYKNQRLIQVGNQAGLRPLTERMVGSLPASGSVVMADDEPMLQALHVTLRHTGKDKDFVLVHSQSLVQRSYHRHLHKQYPNRWPLLPGDETSRQPVDIGTQLQVFAEVQKQIPFYYLQPTFGPYLEKHYLKPVGLVFQMIPYAGDVVLPPAMSASEIDATDKAWKEFLPNQLPVYEAPSKNTEQYLPVAIVATIVSRMLNYFGVEIQRTGDFKRADEYFALALRVNPKNPTAFVNHQFNQQWQAGKKEGLPTSPEAGKLFSDYAGNHGLLLGRNGPPDEPTICFLISQYFASARNFRQAAHYLSRTMSFLPEFIPGQLGLISSLIQLGVPDRALTLIAETRKWPGLKSMEITDQVALDEREAWAYVAKGDMPKAEQILRDAQARYPSLAGPFSTLVDIFIATGRGTNAMTVIEQQLRVQPKDVNALINYGVLLYQQGQITNAIAYFDRALAIEPNSKVALMNRAMSHLITGKLDQAEADYIMLERNLPSRSHLIVYGLQEVSWRRKDRKNCLRYLEEYLEIAPKGTPEYQFLEERSKRLKDGTI